jgi:hypothetical protein
MGGYRKDSFTTSSIKRAKMSIAQDAQLVIGYIEEHDEDES